MLPRSCSVRLGWQGRPAPVRALLRTSSAAAQAPAPLTANAVAPMDGPRAGVCRARGRYADAVVPTTTMRTLPAATPRTGNSARAAPGGRVAKAQSVAGQRRPPRGRVRAFRSRRTVIGRGVGSTAGRLAPLQWAPTKDTGNAVFPRFGAPSCVSAERMPPTQAARSTPHRGMRPAGLPAPRAAQPGERQHAADDAPPRRNSEQEPGW